MMMYVLRRLLREGEHNDFWLVLSEDEEVGSEYGVGRVVDWLQEHDLLPPVVFAPDGGPDFSYVEKEKGVLPFEARVDGHAAHASRPYLGHNAIDGMMALFRRLRHEFPNPASEDDWKPSLSMTTITAGNAANQIPDRCVAGFDLRLTEDQRIDELKERLRRLARDFEESEESGPCRASLEFGEAAPATHYPRDAAVARRFLSILERISGGPPEILRSAGASNGRLYVAADPRIYVLMSSPTTGGAHSDREWLAAGSLEPYYRLVYATARLDARRPAAPGTGIREQPGPRPTTELVSSVGAGEISGADYEGEERRTHPRYQLRFRVNLTYERPGGELREVTGRTLNISRGGLRARVDRPSARAGSPW